MTLALNAGVPLEIVQKVMGHRTAGIVMKHYFQPGREDFRRTLAGKMSALLVGGALGALRASDYVRRRTPVRLLYRSA